MEWWIWLAIGIGILLLLILIVYLIYRYRKSRKKTTQSPNANMSKRQRNYMNTLPPEQAEIFMRMTKAERRNAMKYGNLTPQMRATGQGLNNMSIEDRMLNIKKGESIFYETLRDAEFLRRVDEYLRKTKESPQQPLSRELREGIKIYGRAFYTRYLEYLKTMGLQPVSDDEFIDNVIRYRNNVLNRDS